MQIEANFLACSDRDLVGSTTVLPSSENPTHTITCLSAELRPMLARPALAYTQSSTQRHLNTRCQRDVRVVWVPEVKVHTLLLHVPTSKVNGQL